MDMNINNVKLFCGECTDIMGKYIPTASIDLIVTSPPYDNLRSYNGYSFNHKHVLKGIYDVLKEGGVCVWIVGDATIRGSETGTSFRQALDAIEIGFKLHDTMIYKKDSPSFPSNRNSLRYSQIFEYMFVFSKGKPKTVNLICDKKNKWGGHTSWGKSNYRGSDGSLKEGKIVKVAEYSPRENIWEYSTGINCSTKDRIAFKHPAIFPEQLAKDHILSWSNEGDTVLDPMCGSGTTIKVANSLKRKAIGIDISEEYLGICKDRLEFSQLKIF